ncbi:hypothetical protein GCM10007079_48240 [Nocardiopsis terrae]|uniref:DUF397 domain-containing protein n=1 Tax=Nocardiopsis terrae TaxID=372655 RepID=A0ABR9HAJ5_9ACTN|nr:DUF397 domain-containing protein [Nocardiopsis terrae]MBE1456059.1 hypothetical protein [Nocardiopsis terrae]GHC96088.1 hypothetical protein GCM10007079_48240 [Nocardiopsis terrae]
MPTTPKQHQSDCVEVADLPVVAAIRDTRSRNLGHLVFPSSEWSALLETIRRQSGI